MHIMYFDQFHPIYIAFLTALPLPPSFLTDFCYYCAIFIHLFNYFYNIHPITTPLLLSLKQSPFYNHVILLLLSLDSTHE
jgi:hypothetical protein